jgi:hypothetical protein
MSPDSVKKPALSPKKKETPKVKKPTQYDDALDAMKNDRKRY